MHFLRLIRSCHPEAIVLSPGPALDCTVCQKRVVENVYHLINQPHDSDYFFSSQLAQAYAAWTGDVRVPMSFPLSHVEGILDTIVAGQPLDRVIQSIRFLRALNAPFTTDPRQTPFPGMDTFLEDFLNIIYEHPQAESTNERIALDALMKSMHAILAQKEAINPFETYFTTLVPYVQKCAAEWQPFPAEPEDPNLARELHSQLIRSYLIRKVFGRYSISFDVIHIMVCCFACSCDMDVVGNWAIDFLVRICRGDFSWQRYEGCPFVKTMQKLVQSEINYKKNSHYYHQVIKHFQKGESIDQYSNLWHPFHQVQAFLKKKFLLLNTSPELTDMLFINLFPAVLFPDYADQVGFTMGFNHLVMSMNRRNGELPKGTFKKAKLIHSVVQRFVHRVREFDASTPQNYWNLEMVKLFFASDAAFEDEIMQVIQILMIDEE